MAYNRQQQVKPKGGFYPETKVYFDGSHYIAIPHTERPYRPRKKPVEEVITFEEEKPEESETTQSESVCELQESSASAEEADALISVENIDTPSNIVEIPQKQLTKKQLFEKLYNENLYVKLRERRKIILDGMLPYFDNYDSAFEYVQNNLWRKRRNLIARRIRLTRKANLQAFNYFVTFTYNDALHTEKTFKKKLTNCLSLFRSRKQWKYIGVWERSPKKQRLHFHGVFDIPEGTMPGVLFETNDYNFKSHRRQITVQNSYFVDKFGRCDFEEIEGNGKLGEALAYMMKYIEKSGEKIVYSKGLPQYFISDIMTKDVVTTIGLEDSKLLLYDDFKCWDEGVLVGTVGAKTIKQLRKSN